MCKHSECEYFYCKKKEKVLKNITRSNCESYEKEEEDERRGRESKYEGIIRKYNRTNEETK